MSDSVRIRGKVSGPLSSRGLARILKRRAVDKVTLKKRRRRLKMKVALAAWEVKDRATLGPQRRKVQKVKRKVKRIAGGPRVTRRHSESFGPQPEPGCEINPKNHIGQKPQTMAQQRGYGFCTGCSGKFKLKRGRIPEHEARRPAPFPNCYRCNIRLAAAYPKMAKALKRSGGSYIQVACPSCEAIMERESVARGGTVYGDGTERPQSDRVVNEGLSW